MATGLPGKSQAWNLLNKLIKYFTNLRHLWGGEKKKTKNRENDGTPELEQAEGDAKDAAPVSSLVGIQKPLEVRVKLTPAPQAAYISVNEPLFS